MRNSRRRGPDHRLLARRLTGRAARLDPRQVRRVVRHRRQPVREDFPGPHSRRRHPVLADPDRRVGGPHLLRKPQLARPRAPRRHPLRHHHLSPRHRKVPTPLGTRAVPADRPVALPRSRRALPLTGGSRVLRPRPAGGPRGGAGGRPVNPSRMIGVRTVETSATTAGSPPPCRACPQRPSRPTSTNRPQRMLFGRNLGYSRSPCSSWWPTEATSWISWSARRRS